jgi:hypothetical protein
VRHRKLEEGKGLRRSLLGVGSGMIPVRSGVRCGHKVTVGEVELGMVQFSCTTGGIGRDGGRCAA